MKRIYILFLIVAILTACQNNNIESETFSPVTTHVIIDEPVVEPKIEDEKVVTPVVPPNEQAIINQPVKNSNIENIDNTQKLPVAVYDETSLQEVIVQEQLPKDTVTVSILGLDGVVIVDETAVNYNEGLTVFEALTLCAGLADIEVKLNGWGRHVYIKAIGGLAEFDNGAMSGWLYLVNGKKPGVSAGNYKLEKDDVVVWKYTTNGKD